MPCPATEEAFARIVEYRESGGGYIKLVIMNAASSGAMTSVEIKSSSGVRLVVTLNINEYALPRRL